MASLLPPGPLSTAGSQIVSATGQPVRVAAVVWNQSYNNVLGDIPANVAAMAAAGFNAVRMPVVNATLDADLALIDQVVAAAKAVGMRVIVDNHTNEAGTAADGYGAQQINGLWYDLGGASDGTNGAGVRGTVPDSKFLTDWVRIAQHFAGNDTVIGYDLRHEPLAYNGMCTWGDGNFDTDIRWMYERVGTAIQTVDAAKLIIVEGPQNFNLNFAGTAPAPWGDLSLSGVKPVTLLIPNKLVYSVHDYPSYVAGFTPDSGAAKVDMMNKTWGYLVTDKIAPVWIGEMGANFDGSFGEEVITDSRAWAQTLIDYVNGNYGSLGGPTFAGDEQGIGGSWSAWGYLSGQPLNGTLNADGSIRTGQKQYYGQIAMRPLAAGQTKEPEAPAPGSSVNVTGGGPTGTTRRRARMPTPRSADNTVVVGTSGAITDGAGNLWTISAQGRVAINGEEDATTSQVTTLVYQGDMVWQKDAYNMWRAKTSPTAAWYPPNGTWLPPVLTKPAASERTASVASNYNEFLAERAKLNVNPQNSFVYRYGGGRVTINRFNPGDVLELAASRKSQARVVSDENGGTTLLFCSRVGISLPGVSSLPDDAIKWT